ncbi:MAG: hypothetical protein HY079_11605 [Elusimicrobia bacterium]|nr:hypothetical protein [Elusimicrobiota bacterium]
MRRAILLAVATAVSGCAGADLRGTPFSVADARPEPDRVNAWPLYYRNGTDRSVLWPLYERTPDHVAYRPLFSVYKLDRPRRQYNVLWPLSQFDGDERRNWVLLAYWGEDRAGPFRGLFPVFNWSGDFKEVFPVFWWDEGFIAAPLVWRTRDSDAFFPFWLRERRPDGVRTTVLWPVFSRTRGETRGWGAWPLAGRARGKDWSRDYALWPLGWRWARGGREFRAALPLWAQDRGGQDGWRLLPPLLFYDSWAPGRRLTLSPLWARSTSGERTWETLVPFYYRTEDRARGRSAWLTPLLGRRVDGERRDWLAAPLLSAYGRTGPEHDLWLFAGLAHARWGGERRQDHLLPLYLRDREERLFLSPLYSRRDGPAGFRNWLMLGAHYSWDAGGTTLRVLPPLAEFTRRDGRRVDAVFPFFSRTAAEGRTWTWVLPWIVVESSGSVRQASFFPFWSARRETTPDGSVKSRTRVLWKAYDAREEGGERFVDAFPFLSWDRRADGSRRFSFLGRLYRRETRADGGESLDVLFLPLRR